MKTERCRICGVEMDNPDDPATVNCGGDCRRCMADSGDPGCIQSLKEIKEASYERQRQGYCGVGLDNPKHNVNVGSALRAVGVYGASFLAVTGKRYYKSVADTRKQHRHTPFFQVDDLHDIIPYDCVPVAVDLIEGATPLHEYAHPERAFYIFGSEDATLGKRVTGWCRDVIYVPTDGCMNLAATVNVVLYDRLAKQLLKQEDSDVD